ncbi:PhzF family phenazine biosynthesis protein [Litorivivens sp.]|uniref:PhzF family phenazine biosynthesis protein n=1 Tax=Litorivivens sp. TaxID=2020868 RepID=UPI0035648219
MQYPYSVIDVFTQQPFSGAQITVFTRADGLSDGQMQVLARETNHSETVFVHTPGDRKSPELKVFSPAGECGVGSHTTVAAAFALAKSGAIASTEGLNRCTFVQGSAVIPVLINRSGEGVVTQVGFTVEPQIDRYVPSPDELAAILGLNDQDFETVKASALFVSCDTPYLIVPLRSLDAVYRARFSSEAWAQSSASSIPVNHILLCCPESESVQADFHLRLLAPGHSHYDDPPVGAAVPAFAAFLADKLADGTHTLWLERGMRERRQSLLKVEFDSRRSAPLQVRVGGEAVIVAEGKMSVPAVA